MEDSANCSEFESAKGAGISLPGGGERLREMVGREGDR
jgi:hypothetical protein